MIVHLLTIGAGVLLIFAVSLLGPIVNVDRLLPAAAVIATVYAGAHRDGFGTVGAALVFALLAGLLNSGGRGLLMLSLLPVVGATLFLRTRTPLTQSILFGAWTAAASLLADLTFVLLGFVFSPNTVFWPSLVFLSPGTALVSGGVGMLYGAIVGRVEPLLEQRQQRSALYF
jgi:hypothetical protein